MLAVAVAMDARCRNSWREIIRSNGAVNEQVGASRDCQQPSFVAGSRSANK